MFLRTLAFFGVSVEIPQKMSGRIDLNVGLMQSHSARLLYTDANLHVDMFVAALVQAVLHECKLAHALVSPCVS